VCSELWQKVGQDWSAKARVVYTLILWQLEFVPCSMVLCQE
jgi:hypothetical protein